MMKFRNLGLLLMVALSLWLCLGCSREQKLPNLTPIPFTTPTPTLSQNLLATDLARQATPTPEPSPTPWAYASLTPTHDPLMPTVQAHNPLTGLEEVKVENAGQRPILIKLANWPEELRPQAGLIAADIVFEYFIGAQTNHLAALYFSHAPEVVAPLAPARAPDTRLAILYGANLAYQSARPNIQKVIDNSLPDRNFMANTLPCPAICTESAAKGGNIAVNLPALRKYISQQDSNVMDVVLAGMVFAEESGSGDGTAQRLSYMYADFSVMDWRYEPATGKYQLWQDLRYAPGKYKLEPANDRDTGMPIAFENVIVLYTRYISYGQDGYDLDMRETDPEQQAVILRDGKIYYGKWLVPASDRPIQFKDAKGLDIPLKPGRTWITFASINTISEQTQPGVWELTFSFN
jgi:hypothetical protein